jgi:hypothetical protein
VTEEEQKLRFLSEVEQVSETTDSETRKDIDPRARSMSIDLALLYKIFISASQAYGRLERSHAKYALKTTARNSRFLRSQHIVFSTKGRTRLIVPDLKPELHAYLGGLARELKGKALAIVFRADGCRRF